MPRVVAAEQLHRLTDNNDAPTRRVRQERCGAGAGPLDRKLPPGSPGYRVVGVRHSENGPFQHVTAWIPETIGKKIAEEDISNSSILAAIERHLGTEVKFLEQVVDAALAPRNVAEMLQLRPRTT